jgi:hypothetical protein
LSPSEFAGPEARVFRPDIAVATVAERDGRFLFVEERVRGALVLNQPAGHLEPDEALVIEGRSPKCVYFGAQLWNRYMQSLDYRYHRVSLNHTEIRFEPDGSFRLVVAHRDPGMPNWLDTAGRREGVVFCRWLQSEALPEQPATRVIRLS